MHPRSACFIASLLGTLLLASGCATITRGTDESVRFESEPPGARVRLSNGFSGVTPVDFTLNRKQEVAATFSLEGYSSQTVEVDTVVAGAGAAGFVGNALIGGIIGGGIDIATGATLTHKPNPVHVVLQKEVVIPAGQPPAIIVETPVEKNEPVSPTPAPSS